MPNAPTLQHSAQIQAEENLLSLPLVPSLQFSERTEATVVGHHLTSLVRGYFSRVPKGSHRLMMSTHCPSFAASAIQSARPTTLSKCAPYSCRIRRLFSWCAQGGFPNAQSSNKVHEKGETRSFARSIGWTWKTTRGFFWSLCLFLSFRRSFCRPNLIASLSLLFLLKAVHVSAVCLRPHPCHASFPFFTPPLYSFPIRIVRPARCGRGPDGSGVRAVADAGAATSWPWSASRSSFHSE